MKKVLYFLLVALFFASCQDKIENEPKPTPTPGEDVVFSTVVGEEDAQSRTIYANEATGTAWRINWLDGDKINVYTPQGPENYQLKPYQVVNKTTVTDPDTHQEIEVSDNTLNYAKELIKVDQYGVRWGSQTTQDFYAVYPYTTASDQITCSGSGSNVTITATVAANQINSAPFYKKAAYTEGELNVPANSFVKGDMQNNIMIACTPNVNNGQPTPVNLRFMPVSTVVQFKFNGLKAKQGTGSSLVNTPMIIRTVTLTAPENKNIAGTLKLTSITTTWEENSTAAAMPTMELLSSGATNSVTVDTRYNDAWVTMGAGETATVNMFLAIPDNTYDLTGWTIKVESDKGYFKKTLTKSDSKATVLKPGEIHIVDLPGFSYEDVWEYDLDSWMADIPNDVYFTELSIPGSWYSPINSTDVTYDGTPDYYQTLNIENQFKNGIRAFYLETRMSLDGYNLWTWNYGNVKTAMNSDTGNYVSYVGIAGTGDGNVTTLGSDVKCANNDYRLVPIIKKVIDQVVKTDSEFAVLTISYADGGSGAYQDIWKCRWLEKIKYALSTLGTHTNGKSYDSYIYNEEITPFTTVDDLRGFVVLKIDIDGNSELKDPTTFTNHGQTWSYNKWATNNFCADIPGLYSYNSYEWSLPTGQSTFTGLTSNMIWQNKPTIASVSPTGSLTDLYCSYTVANRTLTGGGRPTAQDRKDAIAWLIQKSAELRNAGNHNVFFMIGAGGTRASASTGAAETNGPKNVAATLTPYLQEQIKAKLDANTPSPLGCVFINFAATTVSGTPSGGTTSISVNSVPLISTIIEMNNKFYLQRKETTPGQQIQSKAPGYSSGMTDNNVNAIDWSAGK